MILRFVLAKLLEGIGAIFGIMLFPIVYLLRFKIDNNPTLFKYLGLWYLTNQDEPNHLENWYGFYELMPDEDCPLCEYNRMSTLERFLMSYEWVAFRNPAWQLKLAIGHTIDGGVNRVFIHSVTGKEDGMVWRNKWITGSQYATFYINNKKCFRYSFTKQIGNKWVNVMLGAKEGRYVSKFRIFSELGRWG
tara:strand:+ start:68 stop:640 length:573 start_codon:yes stop_codon:yes gene_type:complete